MGARSFVSGHAGAFQKLRGCPQARRGSFSLWWRETGSQLGPRNQMRKQGASRMWF